MYLLPKKDYDVIHDIVEKITFNVLFAKSIVNHEFNGNIFVDHKEHPETAYIVHDYGMGLLAGNNKNNAFNHWFYNYALNKNKERTKADWVQIENTHWEQTLASLFGNKLIKSADNKPDNPVLIELNTRVNFKFDIKNYIEQSGFAGNSSIQIVQTDKNYFNEMTGTVIPKAFWGSDDIFFKKGIGFSLLENNQLAATAFSAFRTHTQLEIGIECLPAFRRKGYAQMVCSALIHFCLQNQLEPVWSCKIENTSSYNLALKLGFNDVAHRPYYRLAL